MKVIICGAGRVGSGIAQHLVKGGGDVTVVDRDPELIRNLNQTQDVRALEGHGAHPSVLEEAGARNADILIAVTSSDEVNMVICQIAYSLFKIPQKIARIRDPKYMSAEWGALFRREDIPVDKIILPEKEVAEMVLRRLSIPGAYDSAEFGGGQQQFLAMHLHEDCPVLNTPLNQLTELFSGLKALVVGIKREGKVFIPPSDGEMLAGDNVFLVTDKEDTIRTMTIFGHEEKQAGRVVIVGGGNVGRYVAQHLEKAPLKKSVFVIEENEARANKLAEEVKTATVIKGSGLDSDRLREVGIGTSDMLLCLTNDDQINILTAMLGLSERCERVLCIINDKDFLPLTAQIGLDTAINPRATTISSVLSYMRGGNIHNVHTVEDDQAEVFEGVIDEKSNLLKQKIRDLDLPDTLRIGAINRKGETIMPRGNTTLRIGDRVIVFALSEATSEIENLFPAVSEAF